jgi:hypothetical protein
MLWYSELQTALSLYLRLRPTLVQASRLQGRSSISSVIVLILPRLNVVNRRFIIELLAKIEHVCHSAVGYFLFLSNRFSSLLISMTDFS